MPLGLNNGLKFGKIKLNDMKDRKPFTEEEEKIMKLIVEAHNLFHQLKRGHSMEMQEWVDGVHKLQSILSHRVLKIDYPNYFS